jgi:hypothetical protein
MLKLTMIGQWSRLLIWVEFLTGGVFYFFPDDFSGKRTADPERLSPTYYTSIDAVSAKDVLFEVLINS